METIQDATADLGSYHGHDFAPARVRAHHQGKRVGVDGKRLTYLTRPSACQELRGM